MIKYTDQSNAARQIPLWHPSGEDLDADINLDDVDIGMWMDTSLSNIDFHGSHQYSMAQAGHEESAIQMQATGQSQQFRRESQAATGSDSAPSITTSWPLNSSATYPRSLQNSSPEGQASMATLSSESRSVDVIGRGDGPTSLDQRPGFYAICVGLSGEIDPYVYRYLLHKDSGEFSISKHMYRSVTAPNTDESSSRSHLGSALPPSIPIQFCLTSNEVGEETKKLGPVYPTAADEAAQKSLDHLVSPANVRRLLPLFMEHVFPALPVISRSELTRFILSPYSAHAEEGQSFPPYLLAAIYASSMSFGAYDAHVCLSKMWEGYSSPELWQLVYNGISLEIHTPRLATVSAALLYLNKAPVGNQFLAADSPFIWSFMASTVALATSLGLHLDCSNWNIPNWEKRLRRRLWWGVYSEEKWRSVLMGRPSLIAGDQWIVSEPTADDFDIDTPPVSVRDLPPEVDDFLQHLEMVRAKSENGLLFRHLIRLARIVDDVSTALYTIQAVRCLADNLTRSVEKVKPLRERLTVWYRSLPSSLQMFRESTGTAVPDFINSNACLHFAYMVVEILVYRALVRPLGGLALDEQQKPGQHDEPFRSFLAHAEAILAAAENCASLISTYVERLASRDFAGFWYSWSRLGFATASSFVTILLAQAPSTEHAITSQRLVDKWRQTLTYQSRSFPYMTLGVVRMNTMHWSRLKLFQNGRYVESEPSV
ncbi:hypothetical protein PV04_08795 [Phialophora macrospora]|uniref:Xylanolytic transcriptional activator regulatory domain-containing protein n=1 Tax=Phialophora macrospora TaxID=1851006 RepID=A0A0D2F765_9EURO|nr:hypothetical protein PV04_08795 [Phialophora macrospora]